MLTWKQKCEEERFYYTRLWKWNQKTEEYDVIGLDDLTLEEATKYFNKIRVDGLNDQVDIFREYSDDFSEKIATKCKDFETWDRSEL